MARLFGESRLASSVPSEEAKTGNFNANPDWRSAIA